MLLADFVYCFQACLDYSALALPPPNEASASLAVCFYLSRSRVKPCSSMHTELLVGRKPNLPWYVLGAEDSSVPSCCNESTKKYHRHCCRTWRVLSWKLSQIIPKFQGMFTLVTFWSQVSPVWDKTQVSTITPSLFEFMTCRGRHAEGSHATHSSMSLICLTRTAPQQIPWHVPASQLRCEHRGCALWKLKANSTNKISKDLLRGKTPDIVKAKMKTRPVREGCRKLSQAAWGDVNWERALLLLLKHLSRRVR